MKNIQDEFNFNSNSIFNSFDKLNIYESPISGSFENYPPSNNLIVSHSNKQKINYTNINPYNDLNSITKELNNLSSNQLEYPVSKEDYLNNLLNETKNIQNEISEKNNKLMKENAEIQEKKKN